MRNKKIDISIVMTVYNHEKYIAKALDSILEQQTEYTFEILVGEDCSSDNSKKIIKEYEKKHPQKVIAFYREKNVGATKNAYMLFMAARGRYIAILEGDDYWCSAYKLSKQARFLDEHFEYIGVSHNFCKVDENGKLIAEKCILDTETNFEFKWSDFLEKGFLFQTATLMFHNFFREGCDYSIIWKAHEIVSDLTILTILLNKGKIYILPEVMSAYRYVINKEGTNACSISRRDMALSTLKTVRQYDMLRPYLNVKTDFNKLIIDKKVDYIIHMLKKEHGYTIKRWNELKTIGEFNTKKAWILVGKIVISKLLHRG